MGIEQREGESFLDWKHRLLVSKMNKEIDYDWAEIVEILGLDCSADHLRKLAYGVAEYHNNIQSKKVHQEIEESEDSIAKEITDKTFQMEKVKFQMADQRRELNNAKRWEARLDELEGRMLDQIYALAKVKPLVWRPNVEHTSFAARNRESLLVASDWHRGLFADNHWNKLDDTEFERRVKRLTEKTIQHSLTHGVETLNVFGLGDFVNGIIHVTTRIGNSEDVVTQTMRVCEIIAEMLAEFANYFKVVKYYHARGNHDRVTANKNDEIAQESFADFIPFYLKARLKSFKSIQFMENEVDDEIIIAEICGKTIFATHGHKDRITNVVQNLSLMIKRIPDYVILAHYHHHEENEVQGIEVLINSSFSGVDIYAKDIRKVSNPAQKLIIFDTTEGRLCTYNIRLNI